MRFAAMVTLLAFASSLALPAYADGLPQPPAPQPNEKPLGAVISPLTIGKPAPFTGLLLSPAAVATLIANTDHAQQACDIQIKRAVDDADAQSQYQLKVCQDAAQRVQAVCDAQDKANKAQIQTLTQALQKAQKSSVSPFIWAGLGGVGGILLTVGTVFLVSRATK